MTWEGLIKALIKIGLLENRCIDVLARNVGCQANMTKAFLINFS